MLYWNQWGLCPGWIIKLTEVNNPNDDSIGLSASADLKHKLNDFDVIRQCHF